MKRGMARKEVSMPRPIQLPDKWEFILSLSKQQPYPYSQND